MYGRSTAMPIILCPVNLPTRAANQKYLPALLFLRVSSASKYHPGDSRCIVHTCATSESPYVVNSNVMCTPPAVRVSSNRIRIRGSRVESLRHSESDYGPPRRLYRTIMHPEHRYLTERHCEMSCLIFFSPIAKEIKCETFNAQPRTLLPSCCNIDNLELGQPILFCNLRSGGTNVLYISSFPL